MSATSKVYIGYPHSGVIYHEFHISLMRALQTKQGFDVFVFGGFGGAASVFRTRNKIVQHFLDSECTHLLMCDTDGSWPPSAIKRLLDHDLPIVAGHAMGQDGHNADEMFSAVLMLNEQGQPERYQPEEMRGVVPVDIVGAHFCLIKREVLEALGTDPGQPYAPTRFFNGDTKTFSFIGDDATFCLRAKQAGYQSYVDYDCPVGHIKARVMWPPNADEDDPLEIEGEELNPA